MAKMTKDEWFKKFDKEFVDVHWGDWKHDHLRLKYYMEHNGFTQVRVMPFGEPTGDDTYSATHVYKLN